MHRDPRMCILGPATAEPPDEGEAALAWHGQACAALQARPGCWIQQGARLRMRHAWGWMLGATACSRPSATLLLPMPGRRHTWKGSFSVMLCAQVRAAFMPWSRAALNALDTSSRSPAAGGRAGGHVHEPARQLQSSCVHQDG
jgi:hypothetical protein